VEVESILDFLIKWRLELWEIGFPKNLDKRGESKEGRHGNCNVGLRKL
jgi:hypothetical protein